MATGTVPGGAWRTGCDGQLDAIVVSVASPDACIAPISQRQHQWSQADAPLVTNAAQLARTV